MSRVTLASWIISLTWKASSRAGSVHSRVADEIEDEDRRVADHVAAVEGELLLVDQHASLAGEGLGRPDHAGRHRTDELGDPPPDVARGASDRRRRRACSGRRAGGGRGRGRRGRGRPGSASGPAAGPVSKRAANRSSSAPSWRRVGKEVLVGVEHPAVEVGDGRRPGLVGRQDTTMLAAKLRAAWGSTRQTNRSGRVSRASASRSGRRRLTDSPWRSSTGPSARVVTIGSTYQRARRAPFASPPPNASSQCPVRSRRRRCIDERRRFAGRRFGPRRRPRESRRCPGRRCE